MNVAQIFLSDDDANGLSPSLIERSNTIKTLFTNINYQLYTNQTLYSFIKDNYNSDVLEAYEKLVPYAYKADLGRYCIINKLGGWYFDIGMYTSSKNLHFDLHFTNLDMVCFCQDATDYVNSWCVCNAAFYSKPNNPVLIKAIDLIVQNCKNNYYGRTPLCPTGPTLFGRAIAIEGSELTICYGHHLRLTPTFRIKNHAVVLPDGTILAMCKNGTNSDLTCLGCVGTNDYTALWTARGIYRNATNS